MSATLEKEVGYQEPLDDRTELIITHLRGRADDFGRNGRRPVDLRRLDAVTDILRARIRELVDEALLTERKRILKGLDEMDSR